MTKEEEIDRIEQIIAGLTEVARILKEARTKIKDEIAWAYPELRVFEYESTIQPIYLSLNNLITAINDKIMFYKADLNRLKVMP